MTQLNTDETREGADTTAVVCLWLAPLVTQTQWTSLTTPIHLCRPSAAETEDRSPPFLEAHTQQITVGFIWSYSSTTIITNCRWKSWKKQCLLCLFEANDVLLFTVLFDVTAQFGKLGKTHEENMSTASR